ncbi:MAG: S-layer homology domain-containing protein, partial [Egibacteraceae bacterium]
HAGICAGGRPRGRSLPRSDGSYGPTVAVRRDQMASFLLRAAAFAAAEDLASQTLAFPDVGAGNPHFANVNGAAQAGLASGFADGTYGPGAGVRRDQMATFVVRLLAHLHGSD